MIGLQDGLLVAGCRRAEKRRKLGFAQVLISNLQVLKCFGISLFLARLPGELQVLDIGFLGGLHAAQGKLDIADLFVKGGRIFLTAKIATALAAEP